MSASTFRSIGLTVKAHAPEKDAVLRPVLDVLHAAGCEVFVDRAAMGDCVSTKDLPALERGQAIDLLIVVGGDGTILRTIREMSPTDVPIVGINAGSVGFLTEIALTDVADILPRLLQGEGVIEKRSCMSVDIVRGNETVFQAMALNDAVISQGSISRLLDLQASVGGDLLATYHADGLIVATPTGSTAYSLAAGGPVVHPTVPALILTPINPHSFTQKPIVIPGDALVEVVIGKGDAPSFTNVTVGLTVDGQVYQALQAADRIHVKTASSISFLRLNTDAFYRALRTKLKWGEGLEE